MEDFLKYARQISLPDFGEQGQRNLRASSIAVVGAGGVGSGALPLLAASGIGRIAIIDCDVVSLSNLHRQTLYDASEVGKGKASVASEKLSRLNPGCKIEFYAEAFVDSAKFESIIKDCDLCIDATDSFSSRLCVSKVCSRLAKPEILASAGGYVAQLMVFGKDFYFDKYVGEDSSAATEKSAGLPIFPAAAHLSGVWAAAEVIAHLSGVRALSVGDLRIFDFKTCTLRKLNML